MSLRSHLLRVSSGSPSMRLTSASLRCLVASLASANTGFSAGAGVGPMTDEPARPIGERLLVLHSFVAQFGERVGFDAAGAAFGCEALEFAGTLRGHKDEKERRGSRCDYQQNDQGIAERVHATLKRLTAAVAFDRAPRTDSTAQAVSVRHHREDIFRRRIIADLAVSWPHGYPCGPGWAHSGDELSGAVTKQSQPLLTRLFLITPETLTIVNRAIGRGRDPVLSGVVREVGASSRVGGIG